MVYKNIIVKIMYVVISGAIMGTFFAIFSYILYFPNILKGDAPYPYDLRMKSDENDSNQNLNRII